MRDVHRKGKKAGRKGKEKGRERGANTQRFWDLSTIVSLEGRPRLVEGSSTGLPHPITVGLLATVYHDVMQRVFLSFFRTGINQFFVKKTDCKYFRLCGHTYFSLGFLFVF